MSRRTLVVALAGLVLAGIALAAVYLTNRPPSVLSREAGLACIAERCTEAGNACANAANAAEATCLATLDTSQCSTVDGVLERMDCERAAARQCRNAADEQMKTCATEGASCYASCGAIVQDRPHYWCTGDVEGTRVSFFCEGDAENPLRVRICLQRPEWQNQSSRLNCAQLRVTPRP
jgi:hypothetical protein